MNIIRIPKDTKLFSELPVGTVFQGEGSDFFIKIHDACTTDDSHTLINAIILTTGQLDYFRPNALVTPYEAELRVR